MKTRLSRWLKLSGLLFWIVANHSVQAYYNSSMGRWLSRDPIEEKGGLNINGFVHNDALSRYDLLGREDIEALREKFEKWYIEQKSSNEWLKNLPDCPCDLPKKRCSAVFAGAGLQVYASSYDEFYAPEGLSLVNGIAAAFYIDKYHPGGFYDLRQKVGAGSAGQQCVYDKNGKLITHGPGAGTPDRAGSEGGFLDHRNADVTPFNWALQLDGDSGVPNPNGIHYQKYVEVRPPNQGKASSGKPCPKNP